MSKGARKTGRVRSRSRAGVPRRESKSRPTRRTVLIVGEGEKTEPNYFRGLRKRPDVAKGFRVTVKKGKGFSPEEVLIETITQKQQAENRGEDYDEVWCVLDVEGPSKRASLDKAVSMAEGSGVLPCLSNPSFEIWFLSHFVREARAYMDCNAVMVRLNNYWKKHCGQTYKKGDDRVYDRVSDRTQTAIDNARWGRETHYGGECNTAECNSSTEVYRLVEHLLGGSR